MSMSNMRQKVLSIFKQLHKTRKNVFNGDTVTLAAVRNQINEEFKKHKDINDNEKVNELVLVAKDVENTIRTTIVQAELNPETGNYKMNITEDTVMLDNVQFDPNAKLPTRRRRTKCDDKTT